LAGDGLQISRRLNQCASAGDGLALNRLAMARNGGSLQVYAGVLVHSPVCASMWRRARPCASMRAHASFSGIPTTIVIETD